jgi:predicted transcriptional regulator
VAAGRAGSVEALAAEALAALKARQEAIAALLAPAIADYESGDWIDGNEVLVELDKWIAEERAAAALEPEL